MSLNSIMLFLLLLSTNLYASLHTNPFIVVLDPAGDTHNPGRLIDNTYERGITLHFAQALKKALEAHMPNFMVVITRLPGETIAPLHAANFSNRLGADLFLSLHFYHEQEPKPRLFLYTFACQQTTKILPSQQLQLLNYDQAYLINRSTTAILAARSKELLSQSSALFDVQGIYTLPCKPLMGIIAPAIMFDIGIAHADDWRIFIDPVVHVIAHLVSTHTSS